MPVLYFLSVMIVGRTALIDEHLFKPALYTATVPLLFSSSASYVPTYYINVTVILESMQEIFQVFGYLF